MQPSLVFNHKALLDFLCGLCYLFKPHLIKMGFTHTNLNGANTSVTAIFQLFYFSFSYCFLLLFYQLLFCIK